jgi:hypothetical protein
MASLGWAELNGLMDHGAVNLVSNVAFQERGISYHDPGSNPTQPKEIMTCVSTLVNTHSIGHRSA